MIFTIENTDKVLSLCKFLTNSVMVKIVKIRHLNDYFNCINPNMKNLFLEKQLRWYWFICTKFSALCYVIFIFQCIFSSLLWNNFLMTTPYLFNSIYFGLKPSFFASRVLKIPTTKRRIFWYPPQKTTPKSPLHAVTRLLLVLPFWNHSETRHIHLRYGSDVHCWRFPAWP